jgi:hypothetical protein
MTVLDFSPTSALSQKTFSIAQNGAPLGRIVRDWDGPTGTLSLHARATIVIADESYDARCEGILSMTYYLAGNGNRIASAQRPSFFHRRFVIWTGKRTLTLAPADLLGLTYELTENGIRVGTITRYVTREMQSEFPDDLPLAVQAFLVWLVELLKTGWAVPAIIASNG